MINGGENKEYKFGRYKVIEKGSAFEVYLGDKFLFAEMTLTNAKQKIEQHEMDIELKKDNWGNLTVNKNL